MTSPNNPAAPRWPDCIAFDGTQCLAAGTLDQVVRQTKASSTATSRVLIFHDLTSELIEVDLRGSADDALQRLAPPTPDHSPATAATVGESEPAARGPGRPKLGVIGREVTLLPRHWDWLNAQPGGASVALRKLVEQARQANSDKDRLRQAQDAAYRFMTAMAGDQPGYEEALRSLFAGDPTQFATHTQPWPPDIRHHAQRLADRVFLAPP